jgi:hypothetical protein
MPERQVRAMPDFAVAGRIYLNFRTMKTIQTMAIAATATALLTGCFSRTVIRERSGAAAPARQIIVVEQPPAAQTEMIGVAPSTSHVWLPGYWSRQGDKWVWINGRWELRPAATATYVPGHWEKRGTGFVWHEGYWR